MKRVIGLMLACLLLGGVFPRAAAAEEPIAYEISGERPWERLTDSDAMTRITLAPGEHIRLTAAEPLDGHDLYLEWYRLPKKADLKQYDAAGALLETVSIDSPKSYWLKVPVKPGCTAIELSAAGAPCTVSTMLVSKEPLPDEYGCLGEEANEADLMVVLASPVYVLEGLSGLLARYAGEHRIKTAIVLMNDGRRYELQEACRALLALGIETAPIQLHCEDNAYNLRKDIEKNWKPNKPDEQLVSLLNGIRPKVVVTLGNASEDVRVSYTNELVRAAVETAKVSGLRLYETDPNGKTVLSFAEPLVRYGGRTAAQAAQDAYAQFVSRALYRKTLPFALALTCVNGADTAQSDLFDGIDKGALLAYEQPTPTPVPTAEPTFTPEPADTPEPTAAEQISSVQMVESQTVTEAPEKAPSAEPTDTPKRTGLFSCAAKEEPKSPESEANPTDKPTFAPTPTETPMPTDTPEPSATPVPTETPAPTPTPISDFDAHFVNDGSGEEIVSVDEAAGTWLYRSDILSVEIGRHETVCVRGGRENPCVYFVAHIYQRGADSFRATFGNELHNGISLGTAQEMADRAKCVLWITGDNLIQMDREIKSILIRDGYLFQKATGFDCLVLEPKTLSMRVVPAKSITAQDLFESGVQNSFSFGPTMIVDGQVVESSRAMRGTENPRTVLGMIEPGHFVAVVVDGRQPGYSMGMTMTELIDLMASLGCQVAYNLDGGMSATMLFLGKKVNRHGEGTDPVSGNPNTLRRMPDGLSWGYSEQHYGTLKPAAKP